MSRAEGSKSASNVVLFSGHMIDAPDRAISRFPPEKAPAAAAAIAKTLMEIGVTPGDIAICGGACGGGLLFAEACLARSMAGGVFIPFEEATFLINSVDFAGADWIDRFLAVKARAKLHVMPDELGQLSARDDPYEAVNRWMLRAADELSSGNFVFIALWSGDDGDGPGGTRSFVDA